MAKTIVRFGAPSCAGKSTLISLLNDGHYNLIDCPAVAEAVAGKRITVAVPRTFKQAADSGTSHGVWAESCLARNDAQVVAMEETVPGADIDLQLGDDWRELRVQLVLPYYLWKARRDWRFANGWDTVAPWVTDGGEDAWRDYAEKALGADEGTIYLDVADYPARCISREEAAHVFTWAPGAEAGYTPQGNGTDAPPDYHSVVRAGNTWYGDLGMVSHMRERFDCALPERVDGLTALVIGAAEGAFAFELCRRGAAFVVAVERRARRLETMRRLRDTVGLPVTGVQLTLGEYHLPNFVARGGGRYGITLMLNVIRHLHSPELRLREALTMSDRLLCETVVGDTLEIGNPPHQVFTCEWMQTIGISEGFAVTEREASLQPEQRMMFDFTRIGTEQRQHAAREDDG